MPANRVLPSDSTLAEWAKTMTHQQIADRVYAETKIKVARSTVSEALSRAGETNRVRYDEVIPWDRIKVEHNYHYALQMLRLKARVDQGVEINQEYIKRLESWEARLDQENAVVAYEPKSPDGFYYVRRLPSDGDSLVRV